MAVNVKHVSNNPSSQPDHGVDTAAQRQGIIVGVIALVAILELVGLTLALAFHYTHSSQATAVLTIVVPVFTTAFGALVGGGAGALAGSAGKRAAEGNLNASKTRAASAQSELATLEAELTKLFASLHNNLATAPGSTNLFATALDTPVTNATDLNDITSRLGRVRGMLLA